MKMSFMNDVLSTLMSARGLLTVDELAALDQGTPVTVTNDELDRLDVRGR
jgi:hypothetical protein